VGSVRGNGKAGRQTCWKTQLEDQDGDGRIIFALILLKNVLMIKTGPNRVGFT
jgi:hypothetical protein